MIESVRPMVHGPFLFLFLLFSHTLSILLQQSHMNISLRKARSKDIDAIVETTNLAFKADTFFKKKPYHNRFTREDVAKMISTDNSIFIVAEVTLGDRDSQKNKNTMSDDSNDILSIHNHLLIKSTNVRPPAFSPLSLLCGSLYLYWEVQDKMQDNGSYREMKEVGERLVAAIAALPSTTTKELVGKFSAVSVPPQFEKKGIATALVAAAEEYLLSIVDTMTTNTATPADSAAADSAAADSAAVVGCGAVSGVRMEMGVINLRTELFPFYEKRGYVVIGDLPRDEELHRIVRDDHAQVCCVLMRKILQ